MAIGTDMKRTTRWTDSARLAEIGYLCAGVFAGLAAAAIWAAGSVVSRHFMTTAATPAGDLALLRYAGALPVAILLVALLPRQFASRIPLRRLLVLVLLAGPLYQALLIQGYSFATAGSGSLLVTAMVPVFSLVLALLPIGGGRPVLPATVAGVVLAALGLLVFSIAAPTALAIMPLGVGIFAAVAAMWAMLNLLVAKWSIEPQRLTLGLVLWSPLFLPVWFLNSGPFSPTQHLLEMPFRDVALQVIVHGWLGALVATALFLFCVQATGATTAAILQAVTPAFAAGLGEVTLGETIPPLQITGVALVILGMVLATVGAVRHGAPGPRPVGEHVAGSWTIRRRR